jgi:hypothetical protein
MNPSARADLIAQTFGGLTDEFYPGSTQKRRAPREMTKPKVNKGQWDANPVKGRIKVNGQRVDLEFFTIGALAKALGRRPNTIRDWIRMGWIPHNTFSTPPILGTRGDAGRRLWTRRQIEEIRRIAEEENIMTTYKPDIRNSKFVQRVREGWSHWL